MDVQYTAALVKPIPMTFWYMEHYSIFTFLDQLISLRAPPTVASVSFALDSSSQVSPEYMDSVNIEFMKVGLLGITLLVAAGDNGVWGFDGYGTRFNPEFPASSPYVTTVGATNLQAKSRIGAESAFSCGGGGFSDYFLQPVYQKDAISKYLQNTRSTGLLPPTLYFNIAGRGYPDLSAIGGLTNPYCVAFGDGLYGGVSGTSGSTSIVAGIIALLNNIRLNAGKPALGFINPLLYANPQCFHDIKDYTKNNCLPSVSAGYISVEGWDPTTGLGTPNYECLAKLVEK